MATGAVPLVPLAVLRSAPTAVGLVPPVATSRGAVVRPVEIRLSGPRLLLGAASRPPVLVVRPSVPLVPVPETRALPAGATSAALAKTSATRTVGEARFVHVTAVPLRTCAVATTVGVGADTIIRKESPLLPEGGGLRPPLSVHALSAPLEGLPVAATDTLVIPEGATSILRVH